VVKKLLAAKVDVNAEHPEGVSALMYASAGGHLPVVTLLIDNGAEVRHHHHHRHTWSAVEGLRRKTSGGHEVQCMRHSRTLTVHRYLPCLYR
jgi:ankyrin repeat protein